MTENTTGITIRRLGPSDETAIERLAEIDSSIRPTGELLGAEVEGRLLVALSIESGESVANPFARTEELRALVGIRATQLRSRKAARRRSRSRGALAGSPPGAGGRLLTLPRLS
jgi:hypothetical protein